MLAVTVELLDHCTVVKVVGNVDHESAPELEQRLLAEIDAGRANLVIAARHLRYISSSGLRALMRAHHEARDHRPRGRLVFAELAPPVQRTFQLVGFDELFELYPTDAAAANSFG